MAATTHEPRTDAQRKIWDFIRTRRRFTRADVKAACAVTDWQLDNYIQLLKLEGVINQIGREDHCKVWTVHDVTAATELAARQRDTSEGAMWRAMRQLVVFSPADIEAALAGTPNAISERDARTYCGVLVKANYLRVEVKARPGERQARYRLVRNTGPQPPVQRRIAVVVDGNTEQPVWMQGVEL